MEQHITSGSLKIKFSLETSPSPCTPPVVVLLVHGYGEHSGRYRHVIDALLEAGLHVAFYDHRGHGHSEGHRGHIARFAEYHDDLAKVIDTVVERAPAGSQLFLVAHSMGGLISSTFMASADRAQKAHVRGLVMSSPFFKVKLAVPMWKTMAGKLLSSIAPTAGFPSGLTGNDVTRDKEIAAVYDSDPLNGKKATVRWFSECQKAQAEFDPSQLTVPVLCLFGGDDKVTDADETERVAGLIASTDKTVDRLPGHYHEILNEPEPDRTKTIATIIQWIKDRNK
jgi:alpha-beta hydrolase superfamily lysophospholipase